MNTEALLFTSFHVLVAKVCTLAKQSAAYTHVLKNTDSAHDSSEIYAHINSCENFLHVKSLMELSPDSNDTINTNMTQLIFNNCKIIDKSDHWSLLLYKKSLAIRRRKPSLNHGAKASKELIIFQ